LASVLGMDDRRSDDAPAIPETGDDRRRRRADDLNGADGARVRRVEVRVQANLRVGFEPNGPPVAEIAEPCRLALDADAFVEGQRLRDGVVIRCRMRSVLFQLPDVVPLCR